MVNYFNKTWSSRHFWFHLTLSDLRSRWRRSFFGVFWTIIQPLGMTLLLAFVFSRLFKTDITLYAPYILSGIITWEFFVATTTGGSLSFVQADAYIKQCRHPLAIYTLRTMLGSMIVLMMSSIPLFCWALVVTPQHFNASWLAALTIYPILALIAWPLSTLLAYIGVRFRDVPHALGLVLQAMYFVSPVYFEAKMFRHGGLDAFVDYNPIYHVLQLVRAPILEGQWPTLSNYIFSLGAAVIFALLAVFVGRKLERKVIFYL
jgi:lipopolysaccharide transport system permease protein